MFYAPMQSNATSQNWPQPAPHWHAAGSVTHPNSQLDAWNPYAAGNGAPHKEPTPPPDAVVYLHPSQLNTPAAIQGADDARYIQMPVYAKESYNTQSGGAGMELKQQKAENFAGFVGSSVNTLSTVDSSTTVSAGVKTFSTSSEGTGSGAYRGIVTQTDYQSLSGASSVFFVNCRLSAWIFMPTMNCCTTSISASMLDMATQVLMQRAPTHNLLLIRQP